MEVQQVIKLRIVFMYIHSVYSKWKVKLPHELHILMDLSISLLPFHDHCNFYYDPCTRYKMLDNLYDPKCIVYLGTREVTIVLYHPANPCRVARQTTFLTRHRTGQFFPTLS